MKLEFKNGRKKISYVIEKRNVKVYRIGKDYKLVQYNFGERETKFPYNDVELVYYAEMYNGGIEHLNKIDAVIKEDE